MKPIYLTPRLTIAILSNHTDASELTRKVEERHGGYYTYFNLSCFKMESRCVEFKWRGLPFSLTEMVKIITQIDIFLRINIANAAIVCVSSPAMQLYALFICKTYLQICQNTLNHTTDASINQKIEAVVTKVMKSQPYLTR